MHAWGLFAPTALPAEDFLIEYVGELIRSEIEDERERAYRAEGLDSSYLFRIDKDVVIDATKRVLALPSHGWARLDCKIYSLDRPLA